MGAEAGGLDGKVLKTLERMKKTGTALQQSQTEMGAKIAEQEVGGVVGATMRKINRGVVVGAIAVSGERFANVVLQRETVANGVTPRISMAQGVAHGSTEVVAARIFLEFIDVFYDETRPFIEREVDTAVEGVASAKKTLPPRRRGTEGVAHDDKKREPTAVFVVKAVDEHKVAQRGKSTKFLPIRENGVDLGGR